MPAAARGIIGSAMIDGILQMTACPFDHRSGRMPARAWLGGLTRGGASYFAIVAGGTALAVAVLAMALLATSAGTDPAVAQRLDTQALHYLGAFRLPEGGQRPRTFEYGGNAMTFRPDGDASGPRDGFPGSLFITGHERIPYGEVPDGDQIAEVTIPRPVLSRDPAALPRARFVQPFQDVAKGHFRAFEEIPTIGLQYLNVPETGPRIHVAWGQHFEPETPAGTHGWFSPDLSHPDFKGEWFLADRSFYAINGYMFAIPKAWADAHVAGQRLATGRYRDGGWSGMGPALFAYAPWQDGNPAPPPGAELRSTPLLHYASSQDTDRIEGALTGYQHPDDWSGGAWITTASGKAAVLFVGTKATGARYWYGFVNPAGPDLPCVYAPVVDEYTACRMADGSACARSEQQECEGHDDMRGWWSSRFEGQFILYDPDDLARVAAGELKPWEPQPYATLAIDKYLYLTPSPDVDQLVGTGVQRRYRTGGVAFDRARGLLYVLEQFADGAAPVVHTWKAD